jgi:acyl-CoA synthetase (AMP-forming)/AMP-acid ligase II
MGTNPSYTSTELEHPLRLSNAQYLITTSEHLASVQAAIEAAGTKTEVILFTDLLHSTPNVKILHAHGHTEEEQVRPELLRRDSARTRNLHDLLANPPSSEFTPPFACVQSDSTAALMPTSGTTGLPKLAALSYRALIWESKAIADNDSEKCFSVRRLYFTPIFHSLSAPVMVINTLRLGHPAYFMKRFDACLVPQMIRDFEITEIIAPPPVLLNLANNADSHALIQSLRALYTGGAPLAPELRQKFLDIFQLLPPRIAQIWGMTEGGWFTTFKYPEDDASGSVGRPVPGCEITVDCSNAIQLPDGRIAGEMYMRGPSIMTEYIGAPEETSNTLIDGWLRTGDIGYVHDGKVYVVDRAKDLIKVNCWQVSPTELESELLKSPGVEDVAVVGVGHGVDEHPMAFVVRTNDECTAQDLRQHLYQTLARYKVVYCEFRFVDSIPKTASGKILRKELKQFVGTVGQARRQE